MTNQDDIFETTSEYATTDETTTEPTIKIKKERKKRAPLSDERKLQLREQLKAGREKSLEQRRTKALLKKIEKEKQADNKMIEDAEKIKFHIESKTKSKNYEKENLDFKNQIENLKNELNREKARQNNIRNTTPKPEVKTEVKAPLPSIPEEKIMKPVNVAVPPVKVVAPVKPVVNSYSTFNSIFPL